MRIGLLILLILAGAPGLSGAAPALAASDQETAREATRAGRIKPLPEVLAKVEREVPGRVVDVQLDESRRPWTYRIKVVDSGGHVMSVIVNAETGQILSVKGQR